MKTDDAPPEGADPERPDGSLYYCGRESDGGRLAPCTLCEWGGLCPQYAETEKVGQCKSTPQGN